MAVYNIYFSPTGGTKRVGDILSDALSKEYKSIDLIKRQVIDCRLESEDLAVISLPAFGGRVPDIAARRFSALSANGTRAVIAAVFGNRAVDDTLLEMYDLASAAGFKVIGGVEAVAEHSLVREYGAGRPDSEDESELLELAKKLAAKLENNDLSAPELPGKRPYREFKPSAMSLLVGDGCVDCKKCALSCPVEAIPVQNVKTVDKDKCFSCMHCVSICPKGARQNSPELIKALAERLREPCRERKQNKLYI